MSLYCKPGDLAVIVRAHGDAEPATKQFIGRFIRLVGPVQKCWGVGWTFENEPLRGRYNGVSVDWCNIPD